MMLKQMRLNQGFKKTAAFFILFVYIWVLLVLQDFPATYTTNLLSFVISGFLSLSVTALLFHALKNLPQIKPEKTVSSDSRQTRIGIICIFIATLLIMLLHFLGEYTEEIYSAGSDILNQYSQAIGAYPLNNWHPFLHTLLFYIIPIRLTNSTDVIVILQLLYFSMAFTYLVYVLILNGGSRFFIMGFSLYVWINPFLTAWMIYPTKDVAMMIFAIVLMHIISRSSVRKAHGCKKSVTSFCSHFLLSCAAI